MVEPYTLVKVDAQALPTLWTKIIRPGLEKVKQKDKRSGHWIPEHILAHLRAGTAECQLVLNEEGQPVGFMIFRVYPDEFVQVPLSLFVWIACISDRHAVTYILEHELLEKRAKELGLRYVDGISSRFSWGKRVARYGFQAHQIIYRKEVM